MIDLEVAGVNDSSSRRSDRKRQRIDDGVRHPDGLYSKRAGVYDIARPHDAHLHVIDREFFQLVFQEAERQRHRVNRNPHALDEKRQRADVIFVRVREKNCFETSGVLEDVRHVGNDDVDAQRRGVRKHHSAIDDDGRIAILDHHEIHPDLTEAAEWHDAQRSAAPRAVVGYRWSVVDRHGRR